MVEEEPQEKQTKSPTLVSEGEKITELFNSLCNLVDMYEVKKCQLDLDKVDEKQQEV